MRFKRLAAGLLGVCVALSMGGCGTATEQRTVAVIAKSVTSDFFHNMRNGVYAAATEYNVTVTFDGPENEEDYATQNRMIEQAVEGGVDAIVLSAIDCTRSDAVVEEAVRRGVKVLTVDSDIGSSAVSLFIGTDNRAAGRAAALAALDDSSTERLVNIGLVNYTAETDNGRQRVEGFSEYIDDIPNARVVAEITAESNTVSATQAALSLLQEYPQINVLVGFNEWMTLGVGNAIRQAGVADRVRGVGFDSNVLSVSMLETGEMDALIVQNPFAIGYLSIQNAEALLSGRTADTPELYTAVTTVNRENLFDENVQKILFRFD